MARLFRTYMSEAVARGSNFADSLVLFYIGCGSPCIQFGVLNPRTGAVLYWSDTTLVVAPVFTRWSRLIADDPTSFLTDSLGHPMFATEVRYLEWTGAGFRQVFSLDAARARLRR